ncbi:MAG TPA: formyl transferase [Kofleriaceae bacterium]|nr:formyl transferase [Kofleriaceae bacterium]
MVLLAGESRFSRAIWNELRRRWPDARAIVESPIPRRQLVRRRLRVLGPVAVAGQLAFVGLVVPLLRRRGEARVREVLARHGLDDGAFTGDVTRVSSVNTADARAALRSLAPRVVVVHGTRILDRETLACVDATIINMHGGITPFCRGVHGGYWALADGRPDLAGVTVHLVDEGIDTGPVLAQALIEPGDQDSFTTYPALLTAAGLPLLIAAVERALAGTLSPRPPLVAGPSLLRSHPTLWGYLWRRATLKVR